MKLAALVLTGIALAADNAELEAAIARARALSIDGPPAGAMLTRKEEDALLLRQLRARTEAVHEVEQIAGALLTDGIPSDDVQVLRRLAGTHLEFSLAIQRLQVPSYLGPDEAQFYQMSLEHKALASRDEARVLARRALDALGPEAPKVELLDTWQLVYEAARAEATELPRCVARSPSSKSGGARAAARLAQAEGELEHLASDLARWRACLPAEEVKMADAVVAEATRVFPGDDPSMASDVATFIEVSLEQIHQELPRMCGVTDHAATLPAPRPPCLSTPARDAVLAQFAAAETMELASGASPRPADRAAAAASWLRVSRALYAGETFATTGGDDAWLSVRGAQVAARRAAMHAQAERAMHGLAPAEIEQAIALQTDALRWWAFLQVIYDARAHPERTSADPSTTRRGCGAEMMAARLDLANGTAQDAARWLVARSRAAEAMERGCTALIAGGAWVDLALEADALPPPTDVDPALGAFIADEADRLAAQAAARAHDLLDPLEARDRMGTVPEGGEAAWTWLVRLRAWELRRSAPAADPMAMSQELTLLHADLRRPARCQHRDVRAAAITLLTEVDAAEPWTPSLLLTHAALARRGWRCPAVAGPWRPPLMVVAPKPAEIEGVRAAIGDAPTARPLDAAMAREAATRWTAVTRALLLRVDTNSAEERRPILLALAEATERVVAYDRRARDLEAKPGGALANSAESTRCLHLMAWVQDELDGGGGAPYPDRSYRRH